MLERMLTCTHSLDYSYAFLHDMRPVYDDPSMPRLLYSVSSPRTATASTGNTFFISSPLFYQDAFREAPQLATFQLSPDILSVLEDAFEATKYLSDAGGIYGTPAGEFLSASHWLRIQALPVLDPEQGQQQRSASTYVMEACRLAARMHHRAIFRRVPHSHPQNAEDLKRLYLAVYWANLQAWRGIPYIYVWV